MPANTQNKRRTAPSGRKSMPKSKRSQAKLPGNRISRRKRIIRPDIAPARVYRSSAINWPLQGISPFKINSRNHSIPHDELEEKLPYVYQALRSAPGFKDDKEWDGLPSLPELADYLFSEIAKVVPAGYQWDVHDSWAGHGPAIVYYKPCPELARHLIYMPLEWIEELRYRSPELFGLTQAVVWLVAWEFSLQFIDNEFNDMMIHDPDSFLIGDENEDMLKIQDRLKYIKGGVAFEFKRQSERLARSYKSLEHLTAAVKSFRSTTKRQGAIKKWLLLGVKALENPFSIYDWAYPYIDPNCDDGEPIMPHNQLTMEWSFHDEVFGFTEQWINDIYNNTGEVEPVSVGYFAKKIHKSPSHPDHFTALVEFFTAGRSINTRFFESKIEARYDKRREHADL